MKLSANIAAYAVLVVAVILVGVYVTGIDTSTDVSTLEESLLPNVYPPEGESITPNIQGVSFRYPARWTIQNQADALIMSRPVDRFDANAGEYVFVINVAQEASEEPLSPADLLPEDVGDAEVTELERAGLPAVRALLTAPEGIAVFDYVQLSDANIFLQLRNQTPLTEDQWEALRGDIDGLLNSIKAEDVTVLADAFAFTAPDGWEEAIRERLGFGVVTPSNENPEAVVQAVVFPPDQMLLTMTQILPTNPGTIDLSIAEDPLIALELYAELPELPVEITDELEDVTYFGYDGKLLGFASPEVSRIRLAILDMEDGNYGLVLVNIRGEEEYEVYAEDIDALLESVEYTTPDPSLFAP